MPADVFLALGKMPADASPDRWLAAGPWCFAGQEELFPRWEKTFRFAPEPLADPELLAIAAKAAQALCVWSVPQIAKYICPEWEKYPDVYWQTILCSWAIDVSRQLVERALRCRAMAEKWGNIPLNVPLLPEKCSFSFLSEHDFTLHGNLGAEYNHWLFSRILENMWPEAWKKIILPPAEPAIGRNAAKGGIMRKSREKARRLLLNLPFPKLKGMSLKQAFLYSLALAHPCKHKDMSANLAAEFADAKLLDSMPLPDNLLRFFIIALPRSIKNLKHEALPPQTDRPRLHVASVASYEDASYRQMLATWRARGNRLAYAQHGGNYGQVRTACEACVTEYSQDVFFTWGWDNYGDIKGNFVPMPYPQLAGLAGAWHGQDSGSLVFTGTEMAAYGYRLDSHPTPLQFVEYREAKAAFMRALEPEILSHILYRPYFPLPGTLADAAWLLPRFPSLSLCRGNLMDAILNCRLLVLDHHGTTMLEAFAADVPLIMYWNRAHWRLTATCDNLLDMLADVGIWHPTPESAAAKVLEIWDDPSRWWAENDVRKARKIFCEEYARLPEGNIDDIWIKTLKNI